MIRLSIVLTSSPLFFLSGAVSSMFCLATVQKSLLKGQEKEFANFFQKKNTSVKVNFTVFFQAGEVNFFFPSGSEKEFLTWIFFSPFTPQTNKKKSPWQSKQQLLCLNKSWEIKGGLVIRYLASEGGGKRRRRRGGGRRRRRR